MKSKLHVTFNNPLATLPGHTIVEANGQHLPVAIVFSNPEASEASKDRMVGYARLFGQAPEMAADIDSFCSAMSVCKTQVEAAKIAKDFYALFKRHA
jgi:hypothetical protein